MTIIHDLLAGIEPAIKTYGVSALFLMIYLESFGVPLPGESGSYRVRTSGRAW